MTLFYKNAVNVFTDASSTSRGKEMITCAGFATTINGSLINTGCHVMKSTVMYAELVAIHMGLEELMRYRETDLFLNIFSDSKVNIYGLREWAPYAWFKNRKDFQLITKQRKAAANQELLLDTMRVIVQGNVHVSLIHIMGHTKPNKTTDMIKFAKTFNQSNGNRVPLNSIPMEYLREMAEWNNFIDVHTRNYLYKAINNGMEIEEPMKKQWPAIWFPREQDILRYRQLIT